MKKVLLLQTRGNEREFESFMGLVPLLGGRVPVGYAGKRPWDFDVFGIVQVDGVPEFYAGERGIVEFWVDCGHTVTVAPDFRTFMSQLNFEVL